MHSYPSVQALGWIPFFKNFSQVSSSPYQKYASSSTLKTLACDLLFFSGNISIPLPGVLNTEAAFNDFLKTSKNYRGALALRNIKMEEKIDGSFLVYCDTLEKGKCVGYTPYRDIISRKTKVFSFFKGTGGRGSEITPSYRHDADGVFISYFVYFRIGIFGNLLSKILTGHFAPKAKMRVDYYLKKDGKCKIILSGSHIPNQDWNVIDHATFSYDMMTINDDNLIAFFAAPAHQPIAVGNYVPFEISI